MNTTKMKMINIYKIENFDFMGYKLQKKDDITYHHIKKRENNGKLSVDNGALLTKTAHEYLHIIEVVDVDLYNYLNIILKEISDQKMLPNLAQIKLIRDVLIVFEEEHNQELTKKGKLIVKERYKRGRILWKNTLKQ